MYSEYKQPTPENKAEFKKYERMVQPDYEDKLGYAMGIITTVIVLLVSMAYIIAAAF